MRLKDSMDSMNQLSKSIDPKRVALINRSLGDGTIANLSLSPAEQQYMVNARDALYAILRPETGAAITLPEMQEYSKMYLPQLVIPRLLLKQKCEKCRANITHYVVSLVAFMMLWWFQVLQIVNNRAIANNRQIPNSSRVNPDHIPQNQAFNLRWNDESNCKR